jgi:peptide-methionine (S)-S-oxide reductase
VTAPAPKMAAPVNSATSETIVLAGGCFWGVQGVFQHVDGVQRAVSGYAGGKAGHPNYEQVSTGATGHAESVAVTFDPKKISLGEILRIYFSVAHDPTEVDRQGPDEGTQYRSEIFAADPAEAKFARDYIAELDAAKVYPRPIATKVETGAAFYPAEGYHQNYATLHPEQPYIAYNDLPKIENLKRLFPARYRAKPTLVAGE